DGSVTTTCDPASGSTFDFGDTTVTCTATDAAGHSATSTFTVTVEDTTGPTVTGMPNDVTVEATGADGATVDYTDPSASDAVDGSVTPTCDPGSGSTFELGDTTVTCSATDAAGNTETKTFSVTVEDTTKPTISDTPDDITAEATGADGATVNYTDPSASDAVDGSVTTTCDPASGSTFDFGDTVVTCSATDAAGNTETKTFTVTVEDTTKPTISDMPDDITADATGADGAIVGFGAPSASDAVDGSVTVTCDPASGSTFELGVTTVTCSATDAADNTATSTFTVAVEDTTDPTITGTPEDITVEATSADGATVNYSAPSASDIVDGSVTPTCEPATGSTFELGETTVTCTATDAADNTASSTFTVTVEDTTDPTITGTPEDITVEATSADGATVNYSAPSASDIVDGSVTPTCEPASGSTFELGDTTVTCSATDSSDNTETSTFKVTVEDTTAPSKPTLTIEPASPSQSTEFVAIGQAEVGSTVKIYTDSSCDGTPLASGSADTYGDQGFSITAQGDATTSYYASATDPSGNVSPCSAAAEFTNDQTPPVKPTLTTSLASPSQSTAFAIKGSAESGSNVTVYSTNNCTGATTSGSAASFASPGFPVTVAQNSTTSFSATATDAAGNSSACSDPVTFVNDTTAPATPSAPTSNVVSPSTSTTLTLTGSIPAGSTVKVYASNDCSGAPIAVGSDSDYATGIGVVATQAENVYTVAVFDAAGNSSGCSAPIPFTVLQNAKFSTPKLKVSKHRGYTKLTGSGGISGPGVNAASCTGKLVATFVRTKRGKAFPDAKRGTIQRPAAVLRWSGGRCTAQVRITLGHKSTPKGVKVKSYLVLISPKLVAPAASFTTKF
ncbi:MAG: HYR domain-containing protein, partial [Solirubrobacterales bacterium]